MKRHLSNTIYGLKFAMEKKDFTRLKSSSGKKRNDFVAKPIGYVQDIPFKGVVYLRGFKKSNFFFCLFRI